MNAGPTSERVYDALKRQLLSGAMPPDTKLEPGALADDLASSATPVRDALHRLEGERLVESRPGGGFHLPHVTEPALRDLYAWNGQLLRLIVRSWHHGPAGMADDARSIDRGEPARALFASFALRSPNIEHGVQIDAASDRLSAARAAERRVLAGIDDELSALAGEHVHAATPEMVKRLAAYHRRRISAVPDIVRALYRG